MDTPSGSRVGSAVGSAAADTAPAPPAARVPVPAPVPAPAADGQAAAKKTPTAIPKKTPTHNNISRTGSHVFGIHFSELVRKLTTRTNYRYIRRDKFIFYEPSHIIGEVLILKHHFVYLKYGSLALAYFCKSVFVQPLKLLTRRN